MSIPEPKVEHHEGRGIRSCPIFPELRPILDEAFEVFGDKSEYVVAAPQYRAAANTAMGWKNSNLRSEITRLLRRAGVSAWPRLFHSMRASRRGEGDGVSESVVWGGCPATGRLTRFIFICEV